MNGCMDYLKDTVGSPFNQANTIISTTNLDTYLISYSRLVPIQCITPTMMPAVSSVQPYSPHILYTPEELNHRRLPLRTGETDDFQSNVSYASMMESSLSGLGIHYSQPADFLLSNSQIYTANAPVETAESKQEPHGKLFATCISRISANEGLFLRYPPTDIHANFQWPSPRNSDPTAASPTPMHSLRSPSLTLTLSALLAPTSAFEDVCPNDFPKYSPVSLCAMLVATPEMVPLMADINMYELGARNREPPLAVNPAGITKPLTGLPTIAPFCPTVSLEEKKPAESLISDHQIDPQLLDQSPSFLGPSASEDPASTFINNFMDNQQRARHPVMDDFKGIDACSDLLDRSWSPAQSDEYKPSPFLGSCSASPDCLPAKRKLNGRTTKQPANARTKKPKFEPVDGPIPPLLFCETDGTPGTIDLGTPLLDAHRGIHISELELRAEKYKARNAGVDFDKSWLMSFVGRLSPRGELLDHFRCYINGCTQTNKRRDHIVVHIGAHLGQRPFKCPYCPSRFLRKNERKRHELSHTGTRPYTCEICPGESVTFARQDLMKRHYKRMHSIDWKSNKVPMKKIKVE